MCIKDKRGYLLAIIIIALFLRLVFISSRPLWYDEAFAALFANTGPAQIMYGSLTPDSGSAADVHPPGYYILLWGWISLLGDSPFALRLLSVMIGMGILVIVYKIGRAIFDERVALAATALAAISPFQLHYHQEIRMYALLTFLLMISTYALILGMKRDGWRWWVIFAVSSSLAQYTHALAAIYLIALAMIPLLRRDWRDLRNVIMAGIGSIILYLPWLLKLPAQFSKVQTSYWTEKPSIARVITTLLSFVTNLPLPESWLPIALFITLLVIILGGWQTVRAWRARQNGVSPAIMTAFLAFFPTLLLFLISQWQPVFIERALLPSGVMFLLWVSWVLTRSGLPNWFRSFLAFLLLVGMGMGVYQHYTYQGFPYGPYEELDEYLATETAPDDIILHSNKLTMLPAVFYDRELAQSYIGDIPGDGSDTLALPTQQVLGLIAETEVGEAVGDFERVWFVIFEKAIEEYTDQGFQTHPHLAWLESNMQLEKVEKWGEINLYLYSR